MRQFFKAFISGTLFLSLSFTALAQGFVGIYFTKDLSGETNFPMVIGTVDGSSAEKAGLKIGQRITLIDGHETDMSVNSNEIIQGWLKGPVGSQFDLVATDPNDVNKTKVFTITRGAAPTAANRLTNVAEVSRYFPMRLWQCFDVLEEKSSFLASDLIETTKTYNDKELKRYRVTQAFMNEKQEGIFESHIDLDVGLKKEVSNDVLTFVLIDSVENHFLAKKYYQDTKDALLKALKTEGDFRVVDDSAEKKESTAFNFGSFSSKKEEKKSWSEWENLNLITMTGYEYGEIGKSKRSSVYNKMVMLKLIGDGYSWKVLIEIVMKSTL